MRGELTYDEQIVVWVAVDKELQVMRKACLEDQGTPDGKPGTTGYILQQTYRSILEKVKPG